MKTSLFLSDGDCDIASGKHIMCVFMF